MEVRLERPEVLRTRGGGWARHLSVPAPAAQPVLKTGLHVHFWGSGACLTSHTDSLHFVILRIIWVETNGMVLLKW